MSRLLLVLPFLLTLIFNPALADDDDERRSKPAINQVQTSGSSIFVYGNELIKNREDKVFFAAESSSEMIEVPFMEGGDDFLEVMLPYEPGAGTYRLGVGKSQTKLRISELITFGSIGADGRDIVVGGGGPIWSGTGQFEVKDGVYTYHFTNVTYYDQEGNEVARGQITSKYDINNLAILPDQQVCVAVEISLAMYRASGFVLLGTPLTTQQVAQDPTHPDASYNCNGINTVVLAPLEAKGDMVCASGRNKSVNQAGNNFGQLNGNIPTIAQGNFDGSTPTVSEGRIIIPKQTEC
jgi:hypothetical protein